MLKIFIGYDPRQALSLYVLMQSIIEKSTKPVSIIPLVLESLPIKRCGLTPFTYSRFLVPYLNNYDGFALFLDADMILNADISELFKIVEEQQKISDKAVYVCKHSKKFEWASVMLFNCAHDANKILTPSYIESNNNLHSIGWCNESLIGNIPAEWNHLVGYDEPNNDAKLIHFTQGVPAWKETSQSEHCETWVNIFNKIAPSVSWKELMGGSVHAVLVNNGSGEVVPLPLYLFDLNLGRPKNQYKEFVSELLIMDENE